VTRIKFLNGMGQRASQPNGRSPTSQGRVRSANGPGTWAGNTSANNSSTKNYRNGSAPAGTLARHLPAIWLSWDERMRATVACTSTARAPAFNQLSAHVPLLGQRGPAICCTVFGSDPVEPTEDFTSRFSEVTSQLRKCGGVSFMNAQPIPGVSVGLTFDTWRLSSGCDSEINSESQGDLSCRRNKRTRLPRSVRLPYEN
jgi:hypothetical protein